MNWLVKAAAFKVLSGVPKGASLYRYSQERITRSLVPTRDRVRGKVEVALRYWDWLAANHWKEGAVAGPVLDFGAGWHPTIPLMFYSLGIERQYLCDVTPGLNADMVGQTVNTFLSIVNEPNFPGRERLGRVPKGMTGGDWAGYLRAMGMTYHAPYTGLVDEVEGTADVAVCTQVLYFIGRDILRNCFKELRKILKPGGKFLATVYLYDVNATAENGLSPYNHLKYSREIWDRWINSRLMSYNRLKARDYRELLEEAGFKIRHFEVEGPTAADLEDLTRIKVHKSFSRYTREELGAKDLFFAAEKV